MTKFLGDQNQVCFLYESGTYASASGTRQWLGLVQEHSLDENMNVIPVKYQGSTDRNVDTFVDGRKEFTGTFTYFPQDMKMLGFAIGSITETATAGSHIFTETNSDDRVQTTNTPLTTFTVEDSKNTGTAGSNFIRTINGCMIDSFTLTATQGEIVNAEVGYVAQEIAFTSGAVTAVAPTTTRPYMFSDCSLHIPSGTAYDNVTEMALTINNNLEQGHYLTGSRTLKEILPSNREYELTATLWMDAVNAKTLYESYFIAGSEFNAMMMLQGTTGSAYIVLSGCKMSDMETPSPLEGTHEQTLTITPQHVSAVVHDSTVDYNCW